MIFPSYISGMDPHTMDSFIQILKDATKGKDVSNFIGDLFSSNFQEQEQPESKEHLKRKLCVLGRVIRSVESAINREEKDGIHLTQLKCKLCVLKTQFGKTFMAIKAIECEINRDEKDGRSIHLVCTMNTLGNNDQFSSRLHSIEETYGNGSVVVLASKYDKKDGNKYRHVKDRAHLQYLCTTSDERTHPRVIVVCSNSKRFNDVVTFCHEFSELWNQKRTEISRIFIYYDEIHKYMGKIRPNIMELSRLDIVKSIVGYSATPNSVWDDNEWKNIPMIDYGHLEEKNYVGCKDMEYIDVDECENTFDEEKKDTSFLYTTLTKFPLILRDGSRTFIPALERKITHVYVKNLILQLKSNAVVCTLNGTDKSITFKEGDITKTILLDPKGDEICNALSKRIHEYNLKDRPLVITGFKCLSVGQTLMNEQLGSFTSAIFGHIDLFNCDIYQLVGRITGRMKSWKTYCNTQVYCPRIIRERCIAMEECAENLPKHHSNTIVTREEYLSPIGNKESVGNFKKPKRNCEEKKEQKRNNDPLDKEYETFNSQEDAIKFCKDVLGVKKIHRKNHKAQKELLIDGENPSVEQLYKRFWGVNQKSKVRMVPTNKENEWCVYWRPSCLAQDEYFALSE
jgi:hypothetical protein